jgi:multisubunit Na+/H+ antiporter MnhB subunit
MPKSLQHDPRLEKELEVRTSKNNDANSLKEEYPSALGLLFMIVALILAMFLASLDFTNPYRHVFPTNTIPGILGSYRDVVTVVFIIILVAAAASFPAALLAPWTDIGLRLRRNKEAGVAVGAAS